MTRVSAATFLGRFRDWAQRTPDATAAGIVGDAGINDSQTYAELDLSARQVAAVLSSYLAPGARVVLFAEPTMSFIQAFLGCMYSRVVALPLTPPGPPRPDAAAERLARVASNAGAEAHLRLNDDHSSTLPGLSVLKSDPTMTPELDTVAGLNPQDLAFLQYTSGSTRVPKAVIVDQGNLAANVDALSYALRVPPQQTSLSWLPLYHDMGLVQGLLLALATGGTSYIMDPLRFVQRPGRWAQAVSRVRAYVSGAPNFAFELAARKTPDELLTELDLSCWQVAYNGAEPVRPSTLERFGARFAAVGFDPRNVVGCYGLAECTLLVSSSRSSDTKWICLDRSHLERGVVKPVRVPIDQAAETSQTVRVATVGHVPPGHLVRIVDPETCGSLAADLVGEVWVSGPSVTRGYWQSEDPAYRARIAGEEHLAEFFRTGDLGFIHDGLLYISGRIKDVLIVRGRNVQPQDVEDLVAETHPAIRFGAVVAVSDTQGRILIIAEIDADRLTGRPSDACVRLAVEVRRTVSESLEVPIDEISFVPPRSIPKTSSGKVRRQKCRLMLVAGDLPSTYTWRANDPTGIEVSPQATSPQEAS